MRCHGEPKNAPKSLIELYGDEAGFYEHIGDIRAFMSVSMPLEVELKKTVRMTTLFALTLLALLVAVFGIIFYFIRQLNARDEKLLEQANIDALTKIYNRRVFNQDIEKMNPQRKNIGQFLIMLDIDHFKYVNDTYGHSTGDTVLIQLSEIISKSIREHDKFYRIGGEEFAIISLHATLDDAIEFAERLRKEIKASSFEKIGSLTVSIGISQLSTNDTGSKLFDRADSALYTAKENGRDQVQVFANLE